MPRQAKGSALKHLQDEYAALVSQLETQRREHGAAVMKLQNEHEAERAQVLVSSRRQLDAMKQQAEAARVDAVVASQPHATLRLDANQVLLGV